MIKTSNRSRTKKVSVLILLSLYPLISSFAFHAHGYEADTFQFSGERTMNLIRKQVAFGPRSPENAESKENTLQFIHDSLKPYTDSITILPFKALGYRGYNLLANFSGRSQGPRPKLMLGAHWDTRALADRDPNYLKRDSPVLGANDGASGVAVLLELGRLLSNSRQAVDVDLIFFDLEDMGGINGLPFSIGAQTFVEKNHDYRPNAGIIVDMVCDKNLRIPKEINSFNAAPEVIDKVWESARRQRAEVFKNELGAAIIDDHVPFLASGIPVVNLIHYPFPRYWHTSDDTIENCSIDSLEQVGRVLLDFISTYQSDANGSAATSKLD